MIAKFRKFIGWGLIALIVLWMILNLDKVKVEFLIVDIHMPVALVILFSAAAGAGGLYLIQVWRRVKGEEKK